MPPRAGLLSSWSTSGGVFPLQDLCSLGFALQCWKQLSLTSGVNVGMSMGTFPWGTVCGTSQGFEPFHGEQLLLLL